MHTFIGKSTTFNYNSDLSGEVHISVMKDMKRIIIKVDGQDILDFVAEYIRQEKIAVIEQMTSNELLGLTDE